MLWYFSNIANKPNILEWVQRTATGELKGLETMPDEEWLKELGILAWRIKDSDVAISFSFWKDSHV